MAKQIKELRNFLEGTNSTPSAADIPDEAPTYSQNLESLDEEGKLKGAKDNVALREGDTKNLYSIDLSDVVNIPSVSATYKYVIYDSTDEKTEEIGDTTTNIWDWKRLRKEFANAIQSSKYVESATLKPGYYDSNGVWNSSVFVGTGFTLESGLNQTDTQIEFSTQEFNSTIFVTGEIIKIGSEYMRITSIETPELQGNVTPTWTFRLNVTRAYAVELEFDDNLDEIEPTADNHSQGDNINAYGDWRSIEIKYVSQIESPSQPHFRLIIGSSDPAELPVKDLSAYMEIYARNMILIDNKDPNSNVITNDVVFYDKNTSVNPPEYKMKVIENFYKENNSELSIVEPENPTISSSNDGYPESVSLAKGPNAVHIGTGATASSKPQWLGKVGHSQFGEKESSYILEEAELKSIDDGESIFSLSYVDAPFLKNGYRGNNHYNVAVSNTKRRLYAVYNDKTLDSGSYVGKQLRSDDLGFTPTGFGSSKALYDFMSPTGDTDKKPFTSSSWDTGTNDDSTLVKHDDDVSYHFVAENNFNDRLKVIATRVHHDTNTGEPTHFVKEDFGYFILEHMIEIDSYLAQITAFESGEKIKRPPKNGSYINDVYEKNGHVYIQYGHASGFTFDEEYLYTFPAEAITGHSSDTLGDSCKVTVKPITPPLMKLKNWGNDYRNMGHDWIVPEETMNCSGLSSEDWIGQDGVWGSYSNYIRWRNIDMLGFTKDKKHGLYDREYYDNEEGDWVTKEPDTGNFNTYYPMSIDFISDNEKHEIPGWDDHDNRDEGNPKVSSKSKWRDGYLAKTYGFITCSIFTQQGGIVNLEGADHNENGEIACSVFMDGQQVTSELQMDYGRHEYQSWFTYKRRYAIHSSTEPVIETISEMKLLMTDRHSYGVSQRCFPYTPTNKKTIYDKVLGDWEHGLPGFQRLNGATTTNAYTGSTANQIDWNDGDGVVTKQQKFGFRYGCYSSGREATGTYIDKRKYGCLNRTIISLGTATQVSSQNGVNLTARACDDLGGMIGIGKNYKGQDEILTSNRTLEMDKINSYITRFPISFLAMSTENALNGNAGGVTWDPVYNYNPLKVSSVGAPTIQNIYAASHPDAIGLWPTANRLNSGEVQYQYTTDTYTTNPSPDAEYGDKFYAWPSGLLSTGLSPTFTDATETYTETDENGTETTLQRPGNFTQGQRYYWKLSLLYDGYQEGPLSQAEFNLVPTQNYNGCFLDLEMSAPPKRVNAIVIYRKNNINEYYRMVDEVSLEKGWTYDSVKDIYKKTVLDNGKQGATYEAITGIPEDMQKSIVHYGLSTIAQGHLVVADCWHPEIKQGQNFIYKSEPNAFSNFNWTKNYCILPTKPTAIAWFAGKLYAFDLNNMYRINLDNLVLEDTFEGIGCIGPDALIVTDMGMFFCDYQGLYWHNGQKAENIGIPVLKTSFGEDNTDKIPVSAILDRKYKVHAWQDISHKISPKTVYDPKTMTVYFCFQDEHSTSTEETPIIYNGAWKFNLTRKRLDLISLPEIQGVLTGNRNDSYLSGGGYLYHLTKNAFDRLPYSWSSKKFDMGLGAEEKIFYSVKLVFNTKHEASMAKDFSLSSARNMVQFETPHSESSSHLYVGAGLKQELDDNTIIYKLEGSKRKAKWARIHLTNFEYEVDSISIIYRTKGPK